MTEETLNDIQEQIRPKTYTVAEIRAMFEKSHSFRPLKMRTTIERYYSFETEIMHRAYEQAFKDLGLIGF